MAVRPLAFAVALLCTAASAAAEQSILTAIADGQPWKVTGRDGRKLEITFFPDGTVRMQAGLMRRSLSWTAIQDGMCLSGGPQGDRCIRFTPTGTGYAGQDGSGAPMTLSR